MASIYNLSLRGALHLGDFVGVNREKALEWIPSDSLFAALVDSWAQHTADVQARLDAFHTGGGPPFWLTSAFPRAADVRFYPAPPVLPQEGKVFEGDSYKKAKKIRWLSQAVLDGLVNGGDPGGTLIHGSSVWLTDAEKVNLEQAIGLDGNGQLTLWASQTVPHVTVDRLSNASNLFYTGRVVFATKCGLWFAVRGKTAWVDEALAHLQYSGLGGLRSTGHGAFTFEKAENDFPESTEGYGLLLSRYVPASETETASVLQAEKSLYQFVTVGGWYKDVTGHPWRRRSTRMVAEGARLPVTAQGTLVNVRPQDKAIQADPQAVYRYGLAFLIPAGKLAEVI
jgi:CRISPR type III-A-associated RAMP protein Csm4